jgi:hypothetical protein
LRIKVGLVVNPRIQGFSYISKIPAKSAPSLNKLIRSSSIFFMGCSRCREVAGFRCDVPPNESPQTLDLRARPLPHHQQDKLCVPDQVSPP